MRDELARHFEGEELLPASGAPSAALGSTALPGRGGAFRIAWPAIEGALVYRRSLRGGLLRKLTRDRFVGITPRPFAEVALSERLRQRSVPTPEIVFAVVRRYPSGVYRGAVATRWVEGARDLADRLTALAARGEPVDSPRVVASWREVGRVVGLMHAAGVVHADLNLRNVLIQGSDDAPAALVLDLDRSRAGPRVSDRSRDANLARLRRSLRKFPDAARVTGAEAERALLDGYRAVAR